MDKIKKLLEKEIVRYVIAGGATTVVNIVSFYLLRLFTDLSRSVANNWRFYSHSLQISFLCSQRAVKKMQER